MFKRVIAFALCYGAVFNIGSALADECSQAGLPVRPNFELSLSWRFFEPTLISFVPAGVATGGYFVKPTDQICTDQTVTLSLFKDGRAESIDVEIPTELCPFILRSRVRMSDRAARRLSIFGVRTVDSFYGHHLATRVRASRACLNEYF